MIAYNPLSLVCKGEVTKKIEKLLHHTSLTTLFALSYVSVSPAFPFQPLAHLRSHHGDGRLEVFMYGSQLAGHCTCRRE